MPVQLAAELERRGHQVSLVMPAHRSVREAKLNVAPWGDKLRIPIGNRMVEGQVLYVEWSPDDRKGRRLPLYLIDQPDYFDRPQLYGEGQTPYADNCERFVFFNRAALEFASRLPKPPDVIHAMDWPTGLLPAYLEIEYRNLPTWEHTASVFTVPQLEDQGIFWHWDMLLTGLDWKYFNWKQMECYGYLNWLKTGLVFADHITLPSQQAVREVQDARFACGLEGVFQSRQASLTGIPLGLNFQQWNPATDSYLAQKYTPATSALGKAACKRQLQQQFSFAPNAAAAVVAVWLAPGDMASLALLSETLQVWSPDKGLQWVIMGADNSQQSVLAKVTQQTPQVVQVLTELQDPIFRQTLAAADLCLIPAAVENGLPCQLYAFRYGALPVARAQGSLADVVTEPNEETLASHQANGFLFCEPKPASLADALGRALSLFRQQPTVWQQLVSHAMNLDTSWTHASHAYETLYQSAIQGRRLQTTHS